jgi:hypothetical protein
VLHLLQAQPESLRTFLEPMDIPEAGRRLHVTVQVNGGGGGGGGCVVGCLFRCFVLGWALHCSRLLAVG